MLKGQRGWIFPIARDGGLSPGCARVVYVAMPTRTDAPRLFAERFIHVFPEGKLDLELKTGERIRTLERLRQCEIDEVVRLSPPEGAQVNCGALFVARVEHSVASGPGDLIKEIEDVLEQLSGQPSRLERVCAQVDALLRAENPQALIGTVQAGYDALPYYARRYVGSMDSKDGPLLSVLRARGSEEQKAALEILRAHWA